MTININIKQGIKHTLQDKGTSATHLDMGNHKVEVNFKLEMDVQYKKKLYKQKLALSANLTINSNL